MPTPRLSKLDLRILDALWEHGKASIREIQESFPEGPAYSTIQTIVYRLEAKGAVRRVRKIGNADIFEPLISRDVTRLRILDEILSFFGGKAQPMMARLAEAGKLTLEDDLSINEPSGAIHTLRTRRGPVGPRVSRKSGKSQVFAVADCLAKISDPLCAADRARQPTAINACHPKIRG